MLFKHCIFDLYGTLVDIHTDESRPALWEGLADWYARHGAAYAPDELRAAYLAAVAREEGPPVPGLWREIRLEKVFLALLGQKGAPAEPSLALKAGALFRRLSLERLRLYNGARDLLLALRAAGRGVWLLSNAQRIFTLPELDALGIRELFDGIYISSDVGYKKPDRRFYQALLTERRIDPAEAVMVGNDGQCDILGAKALGLATVYVRSNLSPREPRPPADLVLDPLADLTQVLPFLLSEK